LAEAEALARVGSWEWDIPANVVVWSDQLFRIYGMEPGAVEPSYAGFLERVHEDDRASVDERNHQASPTTSRSRTSSGSSAPTASRSSCARRAR
jgi:hypothetical protein